MSTFPPYQQPFPDLPLSKQFAEDPDEATELVAAVRARLDEGETLLCLLSVAKIQPPLDYLAVTNSRVIAGWRLDLPNLEKNLPVVIPIEAVNGVEVSGFLDNVKLLLANGEEIKVGNLRDATDEEALRSAVRTAQSSEFDQGDPGGPGDPVAPPAYELYHRADPE